MPIQDQNHPYDRFDQARRRKNQGNKSGVPIQSLRERQIDRLMAAALTNRKVRENLLDGDLEGLRQSLICLVGNDLGVDSELLASLPEADNLQEIALKLMQEGVYRAKESK